MHYTVIQKVQTKTGFKLMVSPDYSYLSVSQDDFDRIKAGDTIELLISVVPA